MLRKLKLGTKFTLLLTAVFLGGILLSGITLQAIVQREAEDNITTRAEILTQAIDSVRIYTTSNIQPLMGDRFTPQQPFIREIVPAFAAREVFGSFRTRPEYKNFFYKEAAINPTNPKDLADEFETELLQQFRSQDKLTILSGYRTTAAEKLFYISRPLRVSRASCLECHGNPASAPKNMLLSYGNRGGFGWHLGEVVAAQTIYVPAKEVFDRVRNNLTIVTIVFIAIFYGVVLLISRFFEGTVIDPLKQLTAIARQVSLGNMTIDRLAQFDRPQIVRVARRYDEMGVLARAFQEMAHEVSAREQNLTQAVKERTEQLEKARAKAEEADRAKSRFLSHMSHELRTPLNVILGFTQLLTRGGSLNPQQQGYLETIDRSGEHLLTLINDVLEMSKIEAGKTELHEDNFAFLGMLDWLKEMLRLKAETKGLQLIFALAPDLPFYIRTDENKLRQVLINLLGNAIKFTTQGKITLRVLLKEAGGRDGAEQAIIHFAVEDTGAGIASEELTGLFEAFVQTETGRQSQEGTGLGLPISQEFVRLMGGEIAVSSQLGIGTVFQFDLPISLVTTNEMQTQIYSQQVIGLAEGQANYRILVVEDKRESRQLVVELLTSVGFEVREASNGQEAIELWRNWSPHLLLMDLRMPVMDGDLAAREIKASANNPPVIIALTGSVFEEDRALALAAGCDDFVRKPMRAEIIFDKIAKHLDVRYFYAAPPELVDEEISFSASTEIMKEVLATMPRDWVDRLHQAATKVNGKEIMGLIAEIPRSRTHAQQDLADFLTNLVDNFCFDEIIAFSAGN
jgi:signal transduction histidine kinase/FixJ family two-component response regulator